MGGSISVGNTIMFHDDVSFFFHKKKGQPIPAVPALLRSACLGSFVIGSAMLATQTCVSIFYLSFGYYYFL